MLTSSRLWAMTSCVYLQIGCSNISYFSFWLSPRFHNQRTRFSSRWPHSTRHLYSRGRFTIYNYIYVLRLALICVCVCIHTHTHKHKTHTTHTHTRTPHTHTTHTLVCPFICAWPSISDWQRLSIFMKLCPGVLLQKAVERPYCAKRAHWQTQFTSGRKLISTHNQ